MSSPTEYDDNIGAGKNDSDNEERYCASIEVIIETVRANHADKEQCLLFIGAGCSVKAGIPPASGIVEEINKKHPNVCKKLPNNDYMNCMKALALKERQRIILPFIDKARVNWAHVAIAELMKNDYVDRILTTNFDPLIIRACALSGVFPAIYDFATSQAYMSNKVHKKSVFYLQGQYNGFFQHHTDEAGRNSELFKNIFKEEMTDRPCIVVGYSGINDPLFQYITKIESFNNKLFWVFFGDQIPNDDMNKDLFIENKYAYYIKNQDADKFFIHLAHELDCFPPNYTKKNETFSYLKSIIQNLSPYPLEEGEDDKDFLKETLDNIECAIIEYEKKDKQDVCNIAVANESDKLINRARELYMHGEYNEIDKLIKDDLTKDNPILLNLKVSALFSLAIKSHNKAHDTEGTGKAIYLAKAAQQYMRVLQFVPNSYEALYNLGNAQIKYTRISGMNDKGSLLTEAIRNYDQALKIKPDLHEAMFNWGNALAELAEIKKEDQEKEQLIRDAFVQYKHALRIKPDKHEALNNWGVRLAALAKIIKDDKKENLLEEACDKYSQALKIKPDRHDVFNNWGNAKCDLALIEKNFEKKESLLEDACSKYKQALKIKPNYAEAMNNWGIACSNIGRIKKGAEKKWYFDEACNKYEQALKFNPNYHEALNNWGSALAELGRIKDGWEIDEKERLFNDACKKYDHALKINPNFLEAMINWGNALTELGRIMDEKEIVEKERLFMGAIAKYEQALEIKPDFVETQLVWGVTLGEIGRIKEDKKEKERHYMLAREKFEHILKMKPDLYEVMNNLSTTLIFLSYLIEGEAKVEMLRQAEQKSLEANNLCEGVGDYNLACIHALLGDDEQCLEWLNKWKEHGKLPDKEQIKKDNDFDGVRDKPWFVEFMKSLEKKKRF